MPEKTISKQEISELYETYATPTHVRLHCQAVAKFALEIAHKLESHGAQINLPLLETACLLHDLMRIVDFRSYEPEKFAPESTSAQREKWQEIRNKYQGRHHEELAGEILTKYGYPELGQLVASHKFENILNPKLIKSWEEKLLYYSDKRVMHHQVVPLQQRLIEGYQRNIRKSPNEEIPESVQAIFSEIQKLEQQIIGYVKM